MTDHEDDLAATRTEGFKVGEKKTLDEYNQLGKFGKRRCHASWVS